MIAGYEYRWQVEAQLAAFEHERKGAQNTRHLEAIEASEAIFRAELESLGEGDYEEPERTVREGPFSWVSEMGRPQTR